MSCPIVYNDDRWAAIITDAERECVSYARSFCNPQSLVLNIGIGASYCFEQLKDHVQHIDGITVMQSEIDQIASTFLTDQRYSVFKFNKYNSIDLLSLPRKYDIIIDVNLKMFACCQTHWEEFLSNVLTCLKPGGLLLSHTIGFGCYMGPLGKIMSGQLTLEELFRLAQNHPSFKHLTLLKPNLVPQNSVVAIQAL